MPEETKQPATAQSTANAQQPQQQVQPATTPAASPPADKQQSQTPAQPEKQAQPADPKAANQPAQQAAEDTKKQDTKPTKKKFNFNLDTKSLALILMFLTTLMFAQLFIFNTVNQQLKTNQDIEIVNTQQIESQAEITQQLSQYQEQIEIINSAFPDEKGLSDFVQVVDKHLSVYEGSQLQFDTNAPIQLPEEAAPFLPLTISATARLEDFNTFLGHLSNSPYLFKPQRLQITVVQTISDPVKVTLKGRLYVNKTLQ